MFDCPDAKAQARVGLRMTHGPSLGQSPGRGQTRKFIKQELGNIIIHQYQTMLTAPADTDQT